MTEPSPRVRITRIPGPLSERAQASLRRTFGLGADELGRLPAALPFAAVLAPRSEAAADRLVAELERDGVGAAREQTVASFEPCPLHPPLRESDICPSCSARGCPACVRLSRQRLCARCRTSQRRWASFRHARIAVLLLVLAVVAGTTLLDRRKLASWAAPVRVVVHPIVGEPVDSVRTYAAELGEAQLAPVAAFLDAEARRHGRVVQPWAVEVVRGRTLDEHPPAVPTDAGALAAIGWSLSFRWWATRLAWSQDLEPADVRLFVVLHEAVAGRSVEHSTGLEKGRIGVVKLFASSAAEGLNAVVLAHELLHTLGATDKYDAGGRPRAPEGLADPQRGYPQTQAELMAGSIALSEREAKLPDSLADCVVGEATAREIGWIGE